MSIARKPTTPSPRRAGRDAGSKMQEAKVMPTLWDATKTLTFRVNIVISMIVNFGVNFGFEWASLSQWGTIKPEDFSRLYVIKWNSTVNSCILMDMLLTCFLIGSLTVLFGANGIVQDIKKGTMPPLSSTVADSCFFRRLTPVRIMHVGLRALAIGIWWTVVVGLPTVGIIAAVLGGGSMDGVGYAWFKGVFATILCIPIFIFMFVGCTDERLHRGLAFARLVEGATAADAPPMVGNVARV
ncbi:hypothetical protein FNF31_06315 [Cafeteria roenbergensis]|uniref:Uncharacterized protein n=1 Tax=Cafeteria roenbergensis TaxID=33653 RepID=A0A5A8CPR6_CAFRO|nr:hypothetical protein FNF31_06315 [Cafeteria roenbergensis]